MNVLRSLGCPVAVGCGRLSVGNTRGSLLADRASSLVTGLPPLVCKSIARASKVRILHLPPRAQRAPDAMWERGLRSSWPPAGCWECSRLTLKEAPDGRVCRETVCRNRSASSPDGDRADHAGW